MKQKLLLLRLAFIMAKMFFVEFYKESKKELEDKTLYPQSNYDDCLARSMAIIDVVTQRITKYYALTIAEHRICIHGESRHAEREVLRGDLSDKDVKSATRGFWLV